MSLRINTNVEAFNAHRNLNATSDKIAKSMERLSSGLRINRASDDAAGLAISEKMRGQIGGLDQAKRNAQDGISLVQTAEGSLTEVHSILQRVRTLAVQYQNGTVGQKDKDAIDSEVKQLTTELEAVGTRVREVGLSLVRPTLGFDVVPDAFSGVLEAFAVGGGRLCRVRILCFTLSCASHCLRRC